MKEDFKHPYYKKKVLDFVSQNNPKITEEHIKLLDYKISKKLSLKKQLFKAHFLDQFSSEILISLLKVKQPKKVTKPKSKKNKSNHKVAKVKRVKKVKKLPKKEEKPISQHKKKYYEYLTSSEWANIKIDLLEHRGSKCEECGARSDLQVHHKTYDNVFQEEPEDLEILCRSCHRKEHNLAH